MQDVTKGYFNFQVPLIWGTVYFVSNIELLLMLA